MPTINDTLFISEIVHLCNADCRVLTRNMGKKRRKHSTGIGTPNTSRALAAASVAAISKRKAKKRRKNKHGAGSNATAKEPSQVEVEKKLVLKM